MKYVIRYCVVKNGGKKSQAYYLSIIHMIKVLHKSIALPYTLLWLPDKMWRAKNAREACF